MSGSSGGSGFQGWPELAKAAYRGQHLRLEEVYDGLFLIPNALTVDECRQMIAAVEATGELTSTNPRNLPPRKGYAFRNNERYLVRDETFAARLFDYLRPVLSCIVRPEDGATPNGLNPDFRFYRYQRGHSFGAHIDEPVESIDRSSVSLFTLLLYLTGVDDTNPLRGEKLQGGSTLFHFREPIEVPPRTGHICLHFVLHDCLHEGLLVNSGHKWLLRTDVFFPRLVRSNARPNAGPSAGAGAGAGGVKGKKGKGRNG